MCAGWLRSIIVPPEVYCMMYHKTSDNDIYVALLPRLPPEFASHLQYYILRYNDNDDDAVLPHVVLPQQVLVVTERGRRRQRRWDTYSSNYGLQKLHV